jgi:hypothetical protein
VNDEEVSEKGIGLGDVIKQVGSAWLTTSSMNLFSEKSFPTTILSILSLKETGS